MFSHGFVDILAAEQRPGSEQWFQGTADAVKQSFRHMEDHDHDYILILSGDQLYQMDLREFVNQHVASKAEISIATIPVNKEDAPGFGIMKVNDEGFIDKFIEKPKPNELGHWISPVSKEQKEKGNEYLASMGIYIFNKATLHRLFEEHPGHNDFGKEIIPTAILDGLKVKGYSYNGYWTDIGTISSYFEANLDLAKGLPSFNLYDNNRFIYTRARMLPPSKFGEDTKIKHAVISEGCIVQAKEIDNCIIGNRSRIGTGTTMKNCVTFGNDTYETMDELENPRHGIVMGYGSNSKFENCIIDKDVRIGDHVSIIGGPHLEDTETEHYCIKEGIVIIKKGAIIPAGTTV
jgi:glucose-1-phosphate adenylyltransferase